MKMTYDRNIGVIYIKLRKGFGKVSRRRKGICLEVTPDVIIDVDTKGRIYGIEVLGCPPHQCRDLGFKHKRKKKA